MMLEPPVAKRIPVATVRHGHEVVDEYAWLRDRDDPDTVPYLEAENAFTTEWFAPLADLQETLFQEIKGRILETDLSVPGAPWSVVVRDSHRGREAVLDLLPAARTRHRRRRAGARGRQRRSPRATTTSSSARST